MGELAALEAAQAQLAMVQRTVTQAREEIDARRQREQQERAAAVQSFPIEKLGRGYLGTALTTVDGCRHVWTVDFRWVIGAETAPGSGVHALAPALLIASPIAVSALDDSAAAAARASLFAQLIDADAKAYVSLVGGTYSTKSGMVCVQGGGYMEARELDLCLRAFAKAEASADTDAELHAQVESQTRKAALGAANRLIFPRCPYRMLLSSSGDEMHGVFDRPPDVVDGKVTAYDKPRGEIIATVNDNIDAIEKVCGGGTVNTLLKAAECHIPVQARDGGASGIDLGRANVGLGVQNLPLEIGQGDNIIINDADRPDARRRQILNGGATNAASTDQQHMA
jgi:hypothetical protein